MGEAENKYTLPIEWIIQEDTVSQYVTHAFVQSTGREVFVSLFRIQPPLLMGTASEQEKQLAQTPKIKANCVGQFIMAEETVEELIKALQENLKVHRAIKSTVQKTEQ